MHFLFTGTAFTAEFFNYSAEKQSMHSALVARQYTGLTRQCDFFFTNEFMRWRSRKFLAVVLLPKLSHGAIFYSPHPYESKLGQLGLELDIYVCIFGVDCGEYLY